MLFAMQSLAAGIAASYWGAVRVTKEVDLKVIVPDVDFSATRKLLRTAFPQRGRPHVPESVYVIDVNIEGVIMDFLLAVPGYEEQLIERAVRGDLNGFTAWICTASVRELQVCKELGVRDLNQTEQVLRCRGDRLGRPYLFRQA